MTNTQFIDLVFDLIYDYIQLDMNDKTFIERICDIVNAYKDGTEF